MLLKTHGEYYVSKPFRKIASANPDIQVPPVTVKTLPARSAAVTVGVAVIVRGQGLAELALFVSAILPL